MGVEGDAEEYETKVSCCSQNLDILNPEEFTVLYYLFVFSVFL